MNMREPNLFSQHPSSLDGGPGQIVWVVGRLAEEGSRSRRGGAKSARWYGWPSRQVPLDALRDGVALGPFDTKEAARAAALRRIADIPNAAIVEQLERRLDVPEADAPHSHGAQRVRPAPRMKAMLQAPAFEVYEDWNGRHAVYVDEPGLMPPGRLVELASSLAAATRLTQGRHRLHPFDHAAHSRRLAVEQAMGDRLFNLRPDRQAPVWSGCSRLEIEGCLTPEGDLVPATQAVLFRLVAIRLDHDVEMLACFASLDEADAAADELSSATGLRTVDAANFARHSLHKQSCESSL